MNALTQILSHKFQSFSTRKALLVLDVQNDLVEGPGKSSKTTLSPGFEAALGRLTQHFRQYADIVWVRSEFDEVREYRKSTSLAGKDSVIVIKATKSSKKDRSGYQKAPGRKKHPKDSGHAQAQSAQQRQDMDARPSAKRMADLLQRLTLESEERLPDERQAVSTELPDDLFLSSPEDLVCMSASTGADFAPVAQRWIRPSRDTLITKSHYSAFRSTELLSILRTRFVTELYICGCFTSTSVYATAHHAVQHGLQVNIVEDCLGYINEDAHERALQEMYDTLGCAVVNADDFEISEPSSPENGRRGSATLSPTQSRHSVGKKSRQGSLNSLPSPSLLKYPGRTILDDAIRKPAKDAADLSKKSSSKSRSPIAKNRQDVASECATFAAAEPQLPNEDLLEDTTSDTANSKISIFGTGDSILVEASAVPSSPSNFLSIPEIFFDLFNEVAWQNMQHAAGSVPRLVCAQGTLGRSLPIYRHPADELLPLLRFSPTVDKIRRYAEKVVGHELNHVLCQLYRSGEDWIGEHSDKTLDIKRGSKIVNASFGAQRTMRLRSKKIRTKDGESTAQSEESNTDTKRIIQHIPLPHGSAFILGPRSNEVFLHGINHDKRPAKDRKPEEIAFGGARISLTFRLIDTFIQGNLISGQGAGPDNAATVKILHGQAATDEWRRLINAFGIENQSTDFDWDGVYGGGFAVIQAPKTTSALRESGNGELVGSSDSIQSNADDLPRLFLTANPIANLRVALCLEHLQMSYRVSGVYPQTVYPINDVKYTPGLSFLDNDALHTQVDVECAQLGSTSPGSELRILEYLEFSKNSRRPHCRSSAGFGDGDDAMRHLKIQERVMMLTRIDLRMTVVERKGTVRIVGEEQLEQWLAEQQDSLDDAFLASVGQLSKVDCIAWPIVHVAVTQHGYKFTHSTDAKLSASSTQSFPRLKQWYDCILSRADTKRALAAVYPVLSGDDS